MRFKNHSFHGAVFYHRRTAGKLCNLPQMSDRLSTGQNAARRIARLDGYGNSWGFSFALMFWYFVWYPQKVASGTKSRVFFLRIIRPLFKSLRANEVPDSAIMVDGNCCPGKWTAG
jgi:hypothetical protein